MERGKATAIKHFRRHCFPLSSSGSLDSISPRRHIFRSLSIYCNGYPGVRQRRSSQALNNWIITLKYMVTSISSLSQPCVGRSEVINGRTPRCRTRAVAAQSITAQNQWPGWWCYMVLLYVMAVRGSCCWCALGYPVGSWHKKLPH